MPKTKNLRSYESRLQIWQQKKRFAKTAEQKKSAQMEITKYRKKIYYLKHKPPKKKVDNAPLIYKLVP